MKKLLFVLCMLPGMVLAAGSSVPLDEAPVDLSDKESLKRGAQTFVDYCMGCHAAEYMRYNRIGRDLGMSDEEVMAMISTRNAKGDHTKPGELMKIAMDSSYAMSAFGTKIPGLTVIARARGADWLYTYLRTFYSVKCVDNGKEKVCTDQAASRPVGVNNIVFKDVGMPHVLWELQGMQKANYKMAVDGEGSEQEVFESIELIQPGKMSKEQYDAFVGDLVNFMVYMGEPVQTERKRIGIWVLVFLFGFTVIAYLLKKEYWKDIH